MKRTEGMVRGPLTEISFVWPIAAGKEEEWRRALQELEGSRLADSERMRRRLGIDTVRVWLQRTRCGEVAVVHLEVDDLARAISGLAGSEETFERWLMRKVEEFHGVDVACARSDAAPEVVFRAGYEKEEQH